MAGHQGVMVLSNVDMGDETFDSDRGSWNITRAIADCEAGKHKLYGFDVQEVMLANANIEVEEAKIVKLLGLPLTKLPPLIFIVEQGMLWLIDGHHRLHMLSRMGITRFSGYVIEEEVSARYIIWYNGQRLPPWRK